MREKRSWRQIGKRMAAVALIGALLLASLAVAQDAAPPLERAAILLYRSELHPEGAQLTLIGRLLTEAARRSADGAALAELRDSARMVLQGFKQRTTAQIKGAPSDIVASLIGPAALTPDWQALLPPWEAADTESSLHALYPELLRVAASHAGVIWRDLLAAAESQPELATAAGPLIAALAGTDPGASIAAWRLQSPAAFERAINPADYPGWLEARQQALFDSLATLAAGDAPQVDPVALSRERARLWLLTQQQPDLVDGVLGRWYISLSEGLPPAYEGKPVALLMALVNGAQALIGGAHALDATQHSALISLADHLRPLARNPPLGWSLMDGSFAGMMDDAVNLIVRLAQSQQTEQYPAIAHDLMRLDARIKLLAGSWGAYLAQPFREPVQYVLSECLSSADDPAQRDACLARARDWALEGAVVPEAAGNPEGPFGLENLLRELELNPWQRVNYWRGYWRTTMRQSCSRQQRSLNALEWALGARLYLTLLPAEGDAEDRRVDLARLIEAGENIVFDLDAFAACRLHNAGLMARLLGHYEAALNELADALPGALEAFRRQALEPGADISLDHGPDQATRYVPDVLQVHPCDGAASCGMQEPLPAGADLYYLFPRAYRIADQTGLGELALCYRNIAWRERRTQPSPIGGGVMANYSGHLGFTLEGLYRSQGRAHIVFARQFRSEQEYNYLFGPKEPAVLADPCPREYSGKQVEGRLPQTRGWLVPSRVTFVSHIRQPAPQLFARNWSAGEEWRAVLTAGAGQSDAAGMRMEAIREALSRNLAELRAARTEYLYRHLAPDSLAALVPGVEAWSEAARQMAARLGALDAAARLLKLRSYANSSLLRGSLLGEHGLLGPRTFANLHAKGVAVSEMPELGRERLIHFAPAWLALDRAGPVELPRAVAMSLIGLYQAAARLERAVDG